MDGTSDAKEGFEGLGGLLMIIGGFVFGLIILSLLFSMLGSSPRSGE